MAGALPGPATARALEDPGLVAAIGEARRLHLIALGKAAHAMATAAVEALAARGLEPASGIVVSVDERPAPHAALIAVAGDHPLPGDGSARAADRLREVASGLREGEGDLALVLLSGGTSSLVGAPVAGVSAADLASLNALLLGSGLEIGATNVVRKRFSRWGAGRLAVALAPARVACLAVSDVIGDDLASIGSGPCVPDASTAREVRALVARAGLAARLPLSCDAWLRDVERGARPETPKPDDPAFRRTSARVIAGARSAIDAAAARARELGASVVVHDEPISGDAAACGERLAASLAEAARAGRGTRCLLWHGETTVRLAGDEEAGGRCQELALAAAGALHRSGVAAALLAAGTDGRDGPTDAAGACVDAGTWEAIARAGIDPATALARHGSHRALDAAGALVRTGPTGTNVGDVVIGIVR